MLDVEPTLKDKVLAFFKQAPKRYSFAPEMEPAAKEWIREYKKLFDEISAENRSDSAVKVIGKIVDENNFAKELSGSEAKIVRNVGRIVEDNGRGAVEIDSEGKTYWQIETKQDIFRNLKTVKELQNTAYNYILRGEKGSEVKDIIDGEELKFIRISAGEFVYGEDSTNLNETQYKQKMRMSTSILDLIRNATIKYDAPDHKKHKMFRAGFKNYQGRVGIDDTIFKYIVRVGKANNGKIFYDICLEVDGKVPRAKRTSLIKSSTSIGSISQNSQNDKGSDKNSSKNVDSGGRAALVDGKKATSTDVAKAKKDLTRGALWLFRTPILTVMTDL